MPDAIHQETDVLVVGAGPVGLTAACELSRHGARCRVIDADGGPTPANESRALAVWPRTLEVFRGVGVVDRVLARGKRVHAMNIHKGGRRLARVGLDLDGDEAADTPYPFTMSVPQGETERALIERLDELGGAVEWGTRLTGFRQDGAGVTATVTGPGGGGEFPVRARWMIGCDGARSVVRHQLGLTFAGAEYEEPFLLADVRIDWDLPEDEAHVLLAPGGGAVAAFPLPGPGRWRLIDATGSGVVDDPARIVEGFRAFVRAARGPAAEVGDPVWASSFRIHRRIVDRLRVGRVFVAGDAAHVHSPVGGQGMNTGIQDAYNLAWKLALACRGRAGEALLDSYHAERHPVAARVLQGTDRGTRLITLRGALPRFARDRLVGLSARFDFAGRRVRHTLSELGVGYRESPAVGGDRAGPLAALISRVGGRGGFASAPQPGDRAPDVLLAPEGGGGPARLFDVLTGPRHTLLLFPGGPDAVAGGGGLAAVRDLVADRYADLIRPWQVASGRGDTENAPAPGCETLRDPAGSLVPRYGADEPCLYLIRPDGHVGYRARHPDADALRAHLDGLFAPGPNTSIPAGNLGRPASAVTNPTRGVSQGVANPSTSLGDRP